MFPVPWSSRWSWSLHLFLGRPMFLRPFGLYCSASFGRLPKNGRSNASRCLISISWFVHTELWLILHLNLPNILRSSPKLSQLLNTALSLSRYDPNPHHYTVKSATRSDWQCLSSANVDQLYLSSAMRLLPTRSCSHIISSVGKFDGTSIVGKGSDNLC